MQLAAVHEAMWQESANEFIAEEDHEGYPMGARSAGIALVRELCNSFPEKVGSGISMKCIRRRRHS